jgi:hypothetical protein
VTPTLWRSLADAPLDEHYHLEAALAWHELRPAGRFTGHLPRAARAGAPALVPVTETDDEEVAARLARLLCGLAWVTVTRAGTAPGHRVRVEVRRTAYHRVVRALSGTWRHIQGHVGATVAADPGAAAALWRMALLIGRVGPRHHTIQLRTRTPAAAEVLASAAVALDATAAVERVRGTSAVLVCRPADVRRLLVAAGAGA